MYTDFSGRVLIDARKIFDGGVGRYTRNLIEGLLRYSSVTLGLLGERVALNQYLETLSVQIADDCSDVDIVRDESDFSSRVRVIDGVCSQYSVDEQYFFSKRIPWEGFDLYHVPHYPLPQRVPIPTVVTIHDLIHLTHPEKAYYPFVAATLLRKTLRSARTVVTVSEAVSKELLDFAPKRALLHEKLHVVSNTLPSRCVRVSEHCVENSKKTKNNKPYLFAILSQLKPHKGVDVLLRAFEQVTKDFNDVQLYISGQACPEMVDAVDVLGKALGLRCVRLLGEISDEELFQYYRGALAVVVPSSAEGFGLPVLEAHAFEVPVIMRPVPALMELALSKDVIAADFSVESYVSAISEMLESLLSKQESDSSFGTECQNQLALLSLENMTRRILHVYSTTMRDIPQKWQSSRHSSVELR